MAGQVTAIVAIYLRFAVRRNVPAHRFAAPRRRRKIARARPENCGVECLASYALGATLPWAVLAEGRDRRVNEFPDGGEAAT